MRSNRGKTYISSGLLLPSKVIHLVIKRPFHFCFRPGDYVFINIPAIAKYEWHPFTLSSAPEQDDYIWLHIRAVGEWTNRLYDFFEREQERLHNGEVAACIPGSSKQMTEVNLSQADIVSELIAKSQNKPMIDSDAPPVPERRSHNNGVMKNGKEKSENNPFNFEHNRSLKSKPSKLASENFSAFPPPKLERQITDSNAIQKMKA